MYFNCKILNLLKRAAEVNPTVNLLVNLLKPPTKEECISQGIPIKAGETSERARAKTPQAARSRASVSSRSGGKAEMQKRAPTLGNMLVIVLFVLSCFGLLMFLWESFGGPLPLKPKGYRFTVAFPRSFALAEESDVRISGVEVGHVVSLGLNKEGRTDATVEVAGRYAPIRASMHAILRQKTLLGETYVQLIPEKMTGPYLADGGRLANSQVEPSVTLDDILSAFDAKTRRDFQIWQEAAAEGINGRGEQINADFAQLEPFVESANKLVTLLDAQEGAVKAVVHNTGVVFNALASRDHQLEGSIANGERTFHASAEASQAFAEAFRALPAFEHNSARRAQRNRPVRRRSPTPTSRNSSRPSASSRRCSRRPSRSRRSSTASSPRSGR